MGFLYLTVNFNSRGCGVYLQVLRYIRELTCGVLYESAMFWKTWKMQSDNFSPGSPPDHSNFLAGMRNGAAARRVNLRDFRSEPPCIKLGVRPPGGRHSYRPRATQQCGTIYIVTRFWNEFITRVMGWYSPIEWTPVSKLHSLLFSISQLIVSDVHLLQMQSHYCKVNHTTDIPLKSLKFPPPPLPRGFRSMF
jgi:hypothetical protein